MVGGFLLGPPISSTNKTDCHDITEILLKRALKHYNPNPFRFQPLSTYLNFKSHSINKQYNDIVMISNCIHIKIYVTESCNQNVVTQTTIILILFARYIQAITSK